MTGLRLERRGEGSIDSVVARARQALLMRCGGELYLEVPDAEVSSTVRDLAFAGVSALAAALPEPPTGLRIAAGRTLAPLSVPLALDAIRVGRTPLGEECARLTAWRPPLWPGVAQARARCRALLGDHDVAYRWARRSWASPAVLRQPEARAVLRPAVFAPMSLEDAGLTRRGYAADDSLTRWAFA